MNEQLFERVMQLNNLGLLFNGNSFIYADINFHWTDIVCMTDEEFNKAFIEASTHLEILKKEQRKNEQK